MSFIFWTCPDSSPFRQSFLRERDQYTASFFCQVSFNASRFIHATVSTRPVAASCATADTSPSSDQFTLFSHFSFIVAPPIRYRHTQPFVGGGAMRLFPHSSLSRTVS